MMFKAFQRWRHSHGYGVHSPFGYELVTRAVRPGPYAWYGYADIDHALDSSLPGRIRFEARMLLRFLAIINPESIFLPHGTNRAYQAAVRAADSATRIVTSPRLAAQCRILCSYGDFIQLDTLREAIRQPGHCVFLKSAPPEWASSLFESLPEGLMFVGKHNVMVIHHPGMQKIAYPMAIG